MAQLIAEVHYYQIKTKNKMKKHTITAARAALMLSIISVVALPETNAQVAATDVAVKQNAGSRKVQNDFLKITDNALTKQKMTLVGVLKGCPVYQNGKGGFVMVDCSTGDISEVGVEDMKSMGFTIKLEAKNQEIKQASPNSVSKTKGGSFTWKLQDGIQNLKIVGIDIDGHVIQETAKGEQFYLDPATGDMIDFTSHTAFLKK